MKQFVMMGLILYSAVFLRAEPLPENTLKAAYLYNFALLTEWPKAETSGNFDLCFYREDLGKATQILQDKAIGNQKINVTHISLPDEAKRCRMVFIPENEANNAEKVARRVNGMPVLVIAENASLDNPHIVIQREGRKLVFDIRLERAKQSDLMLSSRLLKLARKVEP